jgi:hypothetical protein
MPVTLHYQDEEVPTEMPFLPRAGEHLMRTVPAQRGNGWTETQTHVVHQIVHKLVRGEKPGDAHYWTAHVYLYLLRTA